MEIKKLLDQELKEMNEKLSKMKKEIDSLGISDKFKSSRNYLDTPGTVVVNNKNNPTNVLFYSNYKDNKSLKSANAVVDLASDLENIYFNLLIRGRSSYSYSTIDEMIRKFRRYAINHLKEVNMYCSNNLDISQHAYENALINYYKQNVSTYIPPDICPWNLDETLYEYSINRLVKKLR